MNESELQRKYYSTTATAYDRDHEDDREHDMALAWLKSCMELYALHSYLEVGAGTGRLLRRVREQLPEVKVMGIEPVAALREQGYRNGIRPEELLDGNGYQLAFPDQSFDVVGEFAVLHHVSQPQRMVAEMLRVARRAIFISDCNVFGQGSLLKRQAKVLMRQLGLWPVYNWIRTGGKNYLISEGDGLFYPSYSVFNNLVQIQKECIAVHLMSTAPLRGEQLLTGAAHVALLGIKP